MELAGRLRRRGSQASGASGSPLKCRRSSTGLDFTLTGDSTSRVARQSGNSSMAAYEASLGREASTSHALVNFMMATEADFVVGALGSTCCYLIDGMRNTEGKVMSWYLSVNKDRFW
ncbi:hypothetical protein SETIT_4G126300v2 [Setaria italica]|uniref:Uncharacterized protein n=1 Tax=Setaria italica TaxID=4555 RepID=K3Y035_SETIT|nr:hypothetical protein SETIT_4G126300v2 [Setaria italica]